jgi:hypothetical protein
MSRNGWDLGSLPRTCPTAVVARLCSALSLLHLGFPERTGKVEVGFPVGDCWKFSVGEFFGLAE